MSVVAAIPRDYLNYGDVTIWTTAAPIKAANKDRFGIAVFNLSGNTIYLGKDGTVTVSTGFPVPPNTGIYFDGYIGALWAISAGASDDVRYLEV